MIYQHNGESALELHCVTLINRYLKRLSFPSDRLKFDVIFDYTLKMFASNSIKLIEEISPKLEGTIDLRLNGLFLYQCPSDFFNDCIPHELAHIFHKLEGISLNNTTSALHGYEWSCWLHKLSPDVRPTSYGPESFDDRSSMLYSGGIPSMCECGGTEGFKVLSKTRKSLSKVKDNEMLCDNCCEPFRMISVEDIPQRILDELKFIRAKISSQPHNSPI